MARAKAKAGSQGANLEEALLAAFFNLQGQNRVRLRRRENLRRVIRDGDLESHTVGMPRCTKMNQGGRSKQFDVEAKTNRVRGRRKRSEPHGRLQDATSLQRSSGGNRRSRVERQGRNEPGGGSSRPKGERSEAHASHQSNPGVDARSVCRRRGSLWTTPREELNSAVGGEQA